MDTLIAIVESFGGWILRPSIYAKMLAEPRYFTYFAFRTLYTCALDLCTGIFEKEKKKEKRKPRYSRKNIFPGIFNQSRIYRIYRDCCANTDTISGTQQYRSDISSGHSVGSVGGGGGEASERAKRGGIVATRCRRKKIPLICTFLLARGLTRLSALSFTRRLSKRAQ